MSSTAHHRLRPITSRQNALVKELRRAFQSGEPTVDGYCAIESVHLIEEAVRSGLRFRAVFFSQSALARANKLLPQISTHAETLVVPDDVFSGAVATETPQGVAALVRFKDSAIDDILAATNPLVVVAAGIQDPGNLGTIIRSAEAFGATGILTADNTVSRFNPKVIRASAGSIFRLQIVQMKTSPLVDELRARGLRLLATSSHKGTPLPQVRFSEAAALFIGNEGAGLDRHLLSRMDEVVAIPHSPRVESLNAGIAASIVLYEAARQRSAIRATPSDPGSEE